MLAKCVTLHAIAIIVTMVEYCSFYSLVCESAHNFYVYNFLFCVEGAALIAHYHFFWNFGYSLLEAYPFGPALAKIEA